MNALQPATAVAKIRPTADNVIVLLDIHKEVEERVSAGGIILPRMADMHSSTVKNDVDAVTHEDAIFATVIAAGPGYHPDKWIDHEQGTAPVGTTRFIPMDAAIIPGARVVLAKSAMAADRVYDDEHAQYRVIKAHQIEAEQSRGVVKPLQDRVLVRRVDEEPVTSGGIFIPESAMEKPIEGEVVAVGGGKVLSNGQSRPVAFKPGDRVLFGKFSGTVVQIRGVEHLILREEDLLGLVEP